MTDYKSMFEQAVRTLAAIDEALGIGDDGCGDPDQTLTASQLIWITDMTDATPVIPCAAVLEMGRIPVEGRADEPFAMLLSFQTAEQVRLALEAMQVNLSFMERP